MNNASASTLIVIDLASSRFAEPMVRWGARRAIARAVSQARRGGPQLRVLLHGEDRGGLKRPDGVEFSTTLDYLLSHVGSPDEPWIDAVSTEILYGAGAKFFPTVDGISLADLCRLEVQDYYLEYTCLAGAIRRALTEKPATVCQILTSDPERADALRSAAAGLVVETKSWSPPFIRQLRQIARSRPRFRKHGSDALDDRLSALRDAVASEALEAPVLFLSESAPMSQMFSVVESHLGELSDTRSIRVEFVGAKAAVGEKGQGTVATLRNPSALPPSINGTFRAQWRVAAPQARSLVIERPYAGASSVTSLRAPVAHLLEHLYSERFDQLIEHIELANAIVDLVRPSVIVLGNDRWWVGQAFVRAAQLRGIATLLLQDGLTGDKATWWWISADHLAAFSPAFAKILATHGVAPERVTITGQPRYDVLCDKRRRRDRSSVRAARRDLGLDAETCILLATQPHQKPERVDLALRSLLEVGGTHVLLRPHPNEPPGKYQSCVSVNPGRVSEHAGIEMSVLHDAVDILVTEFSTVALEAAVVGIPVIIATLLGDHSAPEVFDGLSVRADSAEALRDAARSLAESNGEQLARQTVDGDRLYALVGPLDGRSGLRVARLIDSLQSQRSIPGPTRPDSLATTNSK